MGKRKKQLRGLLPFANFNWGAAKKSLDPSQETPSDSNYQLEVEENDDTNLDNHFETSSGSVLLHNPYCDNRPILQSGTPSPPPSLEGDFTRQLKRGCVHLIERFSPVKKRQKHVNTQPCSPATFPLCTPQSRPSTPPMHTHTSPAHRSPICSIFNAISNGLSPKKHVPLPATTQALSSFITPSPTTSSILYPDSFVINSMEDLFDPENNDFFDPGWTADSSDEDDQPNNLPIEDIEVPVELGDDDEDTREFRKSSTAGTFTFPPTSEEVQPAFEALDELLNPPRAKGRGYHYPNMDRVTRQRLEAMRGCMRLYLMAERKDPGKAGNWKRAAETAAVAHAYGPSYARKLKAWCRDFIADQKEMPAAKHSGGLRSAIDDEDLAAEIKEYLLTVGKYICAEDIVKFCETPEMLEKLGRTKTISRTTARRWLLKMGYRWGKAPRGQYVEVHSRFYGEVTRGRRRVQGRLRSRNPLKLTH